MPTPAAMVVVLTAGISAVLVASGSASPQRHSVRPTGFPLVWRATDDALVGIEQTPTLRRIHGVWDLRSDTGNLEAFMYISWREPLGRISRPTTCGGLRYIGRRVLETRGNAGVGWFGLVGNELATAQMKITRRVAIYNGPAGPPVCVEATGTFVGGLGILNSFIGTFKLRDDETLILHSS